MAVFCTACCIPIHNGGAAGAATASTWCGWVEGWRGRGAEHSGGGTMLVRPVCNGPCNGPCLHLPSPPFSSHAQTPAHSWLQWCPNDTACLPMGPGPAPDSPPRLGAHPAPGRGPTDAAVCDSVSPFYVALHCPLAHHHLPAPPTQTGTSLPPPPPPYHGPRCPPSTPSPSSPSATGGATTQWLTAPAPSCSGSRQPARTAA